MKRKISFYVVLVLLLGLFPMSVFALQTEFSGKDDLTTDLNLYSYTTGTVSINSGAKPTQSPVVTADTWIEYEVPQNSLLEFEVRNADSKSDIPWLVQTSTNKTDWQTIQTSISITSYDGSYWYVVKHSASLNNAKYVKIYFPTVDTSWKAAIDWVIIRQPLNGIEISKNNYSLSKNDVFVLSAKTTPEYAINDKLYWSSEDISKVQNENAIISTNFNCSGIWETQKNSDFYNGQANVCNTVNATIETTFESESIRVYGSKSTDSGKADVYIDDVFVETIDLYDISQKNCTVLFEKTNLSKATHTIKLVTKADKNVLSSSNKINIQAIECTNATISGANQMFKAINSGTTNIVVKSENGSFSKSCNVSVSANSNTVPSNAVSVSNENVILYLDGESGIPIRYELPFIAQEVSFKGQNYIKPLEVVMRQVSSQSDFACVSNLTDINVVNNIANANYNVLRNGVLLASFTIRYTLENKTISATLENVVETTGYNFMSIETNSVITTRMEDGNNPWFTYGDNRQFMVELKDAAVRGLDSEAWQWLGFPDADYPNYGFFPIFAMGNDLCAFSFEVQGYVSKSVLDVTKDAKNNKSATLGAVTHYRVKGGATTPNVLTVQKEMFRIDFTADKSNDNKITWLDVAFDLNARMPKNETPYYDGLYMPFGKGMDPISYYPDGVKPSDLTTFDQFKELSKKTANLIDGNPQLYSVKGWLEGGHDMGYPNVTTLNSYLGGEEKYFENKSNMRDLYNANLGFDDNFDDQYPTIYAGDYFKPENIGREKDGGYKLGGLWGAQSHLTDFKYYMQDAGDGPVRINYTADKYKLVKANLIDVLGLCPIRYSYNPASPSSVFENVAGKQKVLQLFKQKGIEIYTEGFSYAMANSLSMVHHFPTEYSEVPIFGGIEVPLSTLTYRETMNYGGFSLGNENPGYYLKYNRMRVASNWSDTQEQSLTREYYLFTLPYKVLANETVVDFSISDNGQFWNYSLTNNSSIKAPSNDQDNSYFNAFYKGEQILGSENGGWSACPVDANRIAFYAVTSKILEYPLPVGQTADKIYAKALYGTKQEIHPVKVEGNNIVVDVPANTPIMVYMNYDMLTNSVKVDKDLYSIQYGYDYDSSIDKTEKWNKQGDVATTTQENDYAQYSFYGTGIDYIAPLASNTATDIYIDAQYKTTISSSVQGASAILYSIKDLPKGQHSIKLVNKEASTTSLESFVVYSPSDERPFLNTSDATITIYENDKQIMGIKRGTTVAEVNNLFSTNLGTLNVVGAQNDVLTNNTTIEILYNSQVAASYKVRVKDVVFEEIYTNHITDKNIVDYYLDNNMSIKATVYSYKGASDNWKIQLSTDGSNFTDADFRKVVNPVLTDNDYNIYDLSAMNTSGATKMRIVFPDNSWQSRLQRISFTPMAILNFSKEYYFQTNDNRVFEVKDTYYDAENTNYNATVLSLATKGTDVKSLRRQRFTVTMDEDGNYQFTTNDGVNVLSFSDDYWGIVGGDNKFKIIDDGNGYYQMQRASDNAFVTYYDADRLNVNPALTRVSFQIVPVTPVVITETLITNFNEANTFSFLTLSGKYVTAVDEFEDPVEQTTYKATLLKQIDLDPLQAGRQKYTLVKQADNSYALTTEDKQHRLSLSDGYWGVVGGTDTYFITEVKVDGLIKEYKFSSKNTNGAVLCNTIGSGVGCLANNKIPYLPLTITEFDKIITSSQNALATTFKIAYCNDGIEVFAKEGNRLQVMNLMGMLILSRTMISSKEKIVLKPGIYIVNITGGKAQKIIIS